MNEAFAVYWNVGEAQGGIEAVDMDDCFTANHPEGWSDQDIGGVFDNCQGYYPTMEEAKSVLASLYKNT